MYSVLEENEKREGEAASVLNPDIFSLLGKSAAVEAPGSDIHPILTEIWKSTLHSGLEQKLQIYQNTSAWETSSFCLHHALIHKFILCCQSRQCSVIPGCLKFRKS